MLNNKQIVWHEKSITRYIFKTATAFKTCTPQTLLVTKQLPCIQTNLHAPQTRLKKLLEPHLFLLETEACQTARTCGPLRTRWPPARRRCGSCCSWGWCWPRSWGSVAAWGRTHSGTPSCARCWSPGHRWVLLLLCPYIAHSPFSPFCGWREKERKLVRGWNNSSKAVSIGEIMIQYSIISELPLRVTESCMKNLSIRLKLNTIV